MQIPDRQFADNRATAEASRELLRALWARHPAILRRLGADPELAK